MPEYGTGWFADHLRGTAEENLVEVRGLAGPEAQRRAKSTVQRKLSTVTKDHQSLNVLTISCLKEILQGKYDEKVFPSPSRAGFPVFALEAIQGLQHILKYSQNEAHKETHLLAFITDYTKFRQELNNRFVGGGYMSDDWREHVAVVSDEATNKMRTKLDAISSLVKSMSA